MRIDAHQHYWDIARGDYGWLQPSSGLLYQNYLPAQLTSRLRQCGISMTIAVQAAPTLAETDFLLALYEHEETIAGVVGWLDLASDGFARQLASWQAHPGFVGIRPDLGRVLHDAAIPGSKTMDALRQLEETGFPVDLLAAPAQLPAVVRLLDKVPKLRAVLDHLGNPDAAGQAYAPWRDHIAEIAAYPGVYCKLSGIGIEQTPIDQQRQLLQPFVDHALQCFGAERVMFGSDWPVSLRSADYADTVALIERLLKPMLSDKELAAVFGGNAAAFYRLTR